MKRFMLFAYSDYYPSGGMGDFRGSFDTLEEAIQIADTMSGDMVDFFDNKEIYDRDTIKLVWKDGRHFPS